MATARVDIGTDAENAKVTLGQIFDRLFGSDAPVRFSAYDGSTGGRADAQIGITLAHPRAAAYVATAPNSLGLARAYLRGDLYVDGVHPGDPYELLRLIEDDLHMSRPTPAEALAWVRAFGVRTILPPQPPDEEVLPRHRIGVRNSKRNDANAISHHYDVSNRFYELVLGDSMTYSCACYPNEESTLEAAQEHKYDLVARKLGLASGMRLLDVGCGWGGMVRHAAKNYGVRALGVTLSHEQAAWATARIEAEGLGHLAEVRYLDYRDLPEDHFDAVSSIGFVEHVGVGNYPVHFSFLRSRLRPEGRLLVQGITRSDNDHPGVERRGFIVRYVFPNGGITGSADMVRAMENSGWEVQHQENLRLHYARTLQTWGANLAAHWDECVAETGLPKAKVWGLYMAGSRLAFERNRLQLHQVLATRTTEQGSSNYPLRPDFGV